ncbi:MAG: efflux RND transporter periplasmic adaptor subunit [Myxococcota bacterium]|nr:efflux RND transporter periplasmic adaptor subunit [Myxococcota bacterium]
MERQPQSAPSGSSRSLRFIFLAIAALGLAGGAFLFSTAPDPTSLPTAETQAPTLQTLRLEARPVSSKATISGLLQPRHSVEIFAEVNGRVTEVGAEALDRVEAEQLLFRMDPILAEVALKRAQAAEKRAESQGVLARSNLSRERGLANVNVASQAALDASENAARQAQAARLEAEASIAEARDRLAKKTVRAPFTGVLRDFPVEVGEYVHVGERVAELLDVEKLEITIGLNDTQIVSVEEGTTVDLRVEALGGEAFPGIIDAVGGALDTGTRKFPIRIEVDNSQGQLLPGMVAIVDLELGTPHEEILLPLEAMVDEFGLKYAYVVQPLDEDQWVAEKRRIEVRNLPFRPTEVAVTAGLTEGELIALSSVRQLRDGLAVRPMLDSDQQARNQPGGR